MSEKGGLNVLVRGGANSGFNALERQNMPNKTILYMLLVLSELKKEIFDLKNMC
jgi:hypothetical protein